jgi:hypothetical protein
MALPPSSDKNTYIIDNESAAETARLMHQDRLAVTFRILCRSFFSILWRNHTATSGKTE